MEPRRNWDDGTTRRLSVPVKKHDLSLSLSNLSGSPTFVIFRLIDERHHLRYVFVRDPFDPSTYD